MASAIKLPEVGANVDMREGAPSRSGFRFTRDKRKGWVVAAVNPDGKLGYTVLVRRPGRAIGGWWVHPADVHPAEG